MSSTTSSVTLAWNDNSSNEDSFWIFGNYGFWAASPNTTSMVISGLPANKAVCFQVYAFNVHGPSATSANVCGTTVTMTPPPPRETTTTIELDEQMTAAGTIFYFGSKPIAGTVTKIKVETQAPVTQLYLIKKPYDAAVECANPQPGHYLLVPAGAYVDVAALLGTPNPVVSNPGFGACALVAQNVPVAAVYLDVTYQY